MAQSQDAAPPRLSSAASLIGVQVGSRLATFVLTQVLVRLTSPEVFGAAHIHLELLLGTVLILSREGFRGALVRRSLSPSSSSSSRLIRPASLQNIAFLPVPIGLALAVCATLTYRTYLAPATLKAHPHFDLALATFAVGASLEVISEPLYTLAIASGKLSTRAWAEGLAVAAKGIGTLVTAVYLLHVNAQDQGSLLPVGVGQACFGAMTLLVLVVATARESRSYKSALAMLLPSSPSSSKQQSTKSQEDVASGEPTFDKETMQLATSMTRQTMVKHLLGESDKFAVARLASLGDQGAYALATNYGSLVVRMLYQPIEESARINLSRTLGSLSTGTDKLASAQQEALSSATFFLRSLLSQQVLFALFLITFCAPLTQPLLLIVAGPTWAYTTPAPAILAKFGSTALPCMAFTGILEGFLQACASPAQLKRYDGWLMLASATFLALVAGLSHVLSSDSAGGGGAGQGLGEQIVVVASAVSMAMRGAYSWRFALNFVRLERERLRISTTTKRTEQKGKKEEEGSGEQDKFSPRDVLPKGITLLTFAVSAAVLRWNASTMPAPMTSSALKGGWRGEFARSETGLARHVGLGVSLAATCAACCFLFERQTLKNALDAIRGRRS